MSPSIIQNQQRVAASEMKFLVNRLVAEQIRQWARAHLMPDPNGGGEGEDNYGITSLYFDTPGMDVFQRNGSFGRAKYRIRRYEANQVVFLERKLRNSKLLSKRRSLIDENELPRLEQPLECGWPGFWFHRRIIKRNLFPMCQVSYDRTARFATTRLGPIRLTLDENLRGVVCHRVGFTCEPGALLLNDITVLELKFCFEMPVLFKNLVEEFALNVRRFSKYRTAAAALGLVGKESIVEGAGGVYA